MWNEEIAKAVEEKKKAYHRYLQLNTEEAKQAYKAKRNMAKSLVRKLNDASWNKFIGDVEHDLHGRQLFAYKLLKHLNQNEKDTAYLNIIPESKWLEHYKALWYDENAEINNEDAEGNVIYEGDLISI